MRDGSYYEGSFDNGEIEGEGVRFWSHDGKLYRGSFSGGECHGQGVIQYKDGSTYEGQFEHNKREGDSQRIRLFSLHALWEKQIVTRTSFVSPVIFSFR